MQLIRGKHNLRPGHRGCVATIGNFDGVHLGHQAVFSRLREQGARLGLASVAVIFEPQPAEYFARERAPDRLTGLRDKLAALTRCRVDRVLCLPFNAALARMSPDIFIREVLVEGLGVRYLAVGDDFRFGADRAGDFRSLVTAGRIHGFAVEDTPTVSHYGARVSSTRVREALAAGNLKLARRLLGREYGISGRVTRGDRIGRSLGFPTANIDLRRRQPPLKGVFAVRVQGAGKRSQFGVANLGQRPTVGGLKRLLEVHLFDFSGNIYGRHLQVVFEHRLREEQRFPSLEALRAQIARDAEAAREWFQSRRTEKPAT
jgi:riboflavin kinase/FMN adenylyltransferase